ncbi:MAG: hypothetical protein PVH52_04875 [bacterium]|jgi:hypothetical protein
MRFASLALLAGLIFCLGCGGGAVQTTGEPVTLTFGDLGGMPVEYEADVSVTTGEGARNWICSFDFSMTVKELMADGGIDRRFDFDNFAVTNYSGSTPEPDPNAGEYSGEFLTLEQDAKGKIVDWRGLDGIKGSTPGGPRFKFMLVYVMFRMNQPPPSTPVTVGSTWQGSFETPVRMAGNEVAMKGTMEYEVEGYGVKAGRDCVKIKTAIQIDGVGDRTVGDQEQLSFEHKEEGKGEMWWDYKNGVIVEFTSDSTANQTYRREIAGKTDVTTDYSGVDTEIKIKMKS